jgi:hypothetical protein
VKWRLSTSYRDKINCCFSSLDIPDHDALIKEYAGITAVLDWRELGQKFFLFAIFACVAYASVHKIQMTVGDILCSSQRLYDT